VGNYFTQAERKVPACYVSNSISGYDNVLCETKADFTNCIIYGNRGTEVEVNKKQEANLNASFQNCLIKSAASGYFVDCMLNTDPKFTNVAKQDYRLLSESPAIGKGKPNIGVDKDILGNLRTNPPDIGAYQFTR